MVKMKKKRVKILFLILIFFLGIVIYRLYDFFFIPPKFELEDFVEFNEEEFTKEKWDKAINNPEKRGKMVYSFLIKNKFLGLDHMQIRELLGELTFYYYSDTIPAYKIKKDGKEYAIAFLSDPNTGLIYDVDLVIINKDGTFY